MKLTTRIDRLEQRAGINEPVKLTIAFFDSVLNGTISDEKFALHQMTVPNVANIVVQQTLCVNGTPWDAAADKIQTLA